MEPIKPMFNKRRLNKKRLNKKGLSKGLIMNFLQTNGLSKL